MKEKLKKLIFGLLGKDPDGVVVCFASGDPRIAARMVEEVEQLVPERRRFVVDNESGSTWAIYRRLRRRFRTYRIALAPVLFTSDKQFAPLRRAAFLLAPTKILAYNARVERHHLKLSSWIASLLFLRGVPLDRIWLRPKWLVPWKRDRSQYPARVQEFEGRPFRPGRKRVAIVTPYFPYPLAHGGAVRIYSLLREIAVEFDVVVLAFSEGSIEQISPVLEHCAGVVLVDKPKYREPRWATIAPPEVLEYSSPAMRDALTRIRREFKIDAVQIEYTTLAPLRGDILVEHDVTFSLYDQVRRREQTRGAWWDWKRWLRFERKWVRRYRRVVVMSEQDRALLGGNNVAVIPNGVDLDRFRPEVEKPGQRLLFIGSFRHFPNVVAFRFFMEQIWPTVRQILPEARVTVVAGYDPEIHWRRHTGIAELPSEPRVEIRGFVGDVRPLYVETNLVMVPTLVSAGTNLKVLEALAMDRAVISTPSGCAGLGLEHGHDVWIADSAQAFAEGIVRLLNDRDLRQRITSAGRFHAEQNFGWMRIGRTQRALLREIAGGAPLIRRVVEDDIDAIVAIQNTAPEASQWTPHDYLAYDCHVAEWSGRVAGFIVSRRTDVEEREILNVAVHPDMRRSGIGSALIRSEIERWPGTHFLEVRESNGPARELYRKLHFEEVGRRTDYYDDPPESAIVMRFLS